MARLAGAHHHLRRDGRAVALTFDDGPDPEFTPLVLDALACEGISATFFFVGRQAVAHPELVRRTGAEGHRVGSHSESHAPIGHATFKALMEDFRCGRASVEKVLDAPAKLFRPPQGCISAASAMALRYLSMETWLWTLDPQDWRVGATPETILERLVRIAPGDVMVFHDGTAVPGPEVASDRSATVAALKGIGDLVRDRGLTFETL